MQMSEGAGRIQRQGHLRSAFFPYDGLLVQSRNFTHNYTHGVKCTANCLSQASWPPSVHEVIYVYGFRFGYILISFLKDAKYAHESTKLSVMRVCVSHLETNFNKTWYGRHATYVPPPPQCNLRHI